MDNSNWFNNFISEIKAPWGYQEIEKSTLGLDLDLNIDRNYLAPVKTVTTNDSLLNEVDVKLRSINNDITITEEKIYNDSKTDDRNSQVIKYAVIGLIGYFIFKG